MSFRTVTLQQLRLAYTQARGHAQNAQIESVDNAINDALMELVSAHEWQWRQASLSLDTVANQSYVDLPTYFASMQTLKLFNQGAGWLPIHPVTMDQILAFRSATNAVATSGSYYYCVTWNPQATSTDIPLARLELFPTPATAVTGQIQGRYNSVPAALAGDTDVPNIPPQFQQALLRLVRANALGEDCQNDGQLERFKFERQRYQDMIDRLKIENVAQSNLGHMRGAVEMANDPPIIVYPAMTL